MSITRPNPFKQAGDASKLSVAQLQQAIKDGTVPPYIGIPLVQEKMKDQQKLEAAMAATQPKPPTVADQVMAEASQGVPSLPTNLPTTGMAGGGIVAFAAGDLVDDDEESDDRDYYNQMALANDEMDAALAERGQQPIVVRHKESTEAKGIGALDPELAARIDALREDYRDKYGKDFRISSGFRTREDQERLYAQRGSNPNLVAAPGHSKHEHGAAVDIPEYIPDELLRAHGLHRPHGRKDPVHIEKMAHGGEVQHFDEGDEVKDKYKGLWPYNAKEAGKFTYGDMLDEDAKKALAFSSAPLAAAGDVLMAPITAARKMIRNPMDKSESPSWTPLYDARNKYLYGDQKPEGIASLEQSPAETARLAQQDKTARGTPVDKVIPSANKVTAPAAPALGAEKTEPTAPASVKPSIDTGTKEEAMDPYAEMRKEIADARTESKKQKGIDQYMAMLSAGLGIMGGTSRHALQNIGQGAQLGIQSLAQSNAQRAAEANALRSAQLGLIKYGAMEKQNQALMDFRNKQLGVQDTRARELAAEQIGVKRDQEKRLQQDAYARQLAEMVRTNQARALAAYKDPNILDETKKAQIFAQADMALQRDPRYRELYKLANNGMLPPDLGASVGGEGWGIKPK